MSDFYILFWEILQKPPKVLYRKTSITCNTWEMGSFVLLICHKQNPF